VNTQLIERTIRKIRQRMFDLPEHKQASATAAIHKLKAKLMPIWQAQHDYIESERMLRLWR